MTTILAALALGVFSLVMAIVQLRRYREALKKANTNDNFQLYDYSRNFLLMIGAMMVFDAIGFYLGFTQKDETNIALSIVLLFLLLSTFIQTFVASRLYYNNTTCFYNGKPYRYKNIKEFGRKSGLPFSRMQMILYTGEKVLIHKKAADKILEMMELRAQEKLERKGKKA
ncbi:MAG: hypothetical protein LBR25_07650 [Erysipelotrichaceae bacterium]|jgi:phosphotransferase system  glucose/maltose/N-acetylglucosamine-specific IIC component|nr:hypothetical protein [Erysipelotrichaceae bacterium]